MSRSFFADDARVALQGVDFGKFSGARILMTGATGAIGIHALAAFREMAREGIKFDLFATYQSEVPDLIAELLDYPQCHVLRGDLTYRPFRDTLPRADYIIHAAGYGQPQRFLENPSKTIRLNAEATMDLLDLLEPQGRLLFTSSSEVYAGLPAGTLHQESRIGISGPDHPRACYIEGKRCGEAACFAAHAGGVGALAVRLGLTYGPGAREGDRRAMYSFIDRGIRERRITLLDRGEGLRSYCYAADAMNMMLRILTDGREPVYNVGGNCALSFFEVAKKIGELLDVAVDVPEDARPVPGAPRDVQLDMTRYEKEFGPVPYTNFDTGLQRTVAWHLERTKQARSLPATPSH